ncbi:MAG: phage holin family protein [Burkholderiaceae bacterium]|jgi:uncharacterized membrane protein YqjE|nr:phage holin family protein [Burkholderiaceae bacterium]
MAASSSPQPAGAARRLRALLADLVELAQVRLELFLVESRLEASRLALVLVLGALGIVLLSLGLIFLAVFITVLLWDTHREVVLAVFTTLFLAGGGTLLLLARARLRQGAAHMFAATRAELQHDRERLRS